MQAHNTVTDFAQKVYDRTKEIPKGRVSTYGNLARVLHSSPRAVGQALKKNPFAPVVPCHRVVKSDGTIGGFFGETTGILIQRKINLLESEGIHINNKKIQNFKEILF